jgi:hypothetical protein
MMGMPWDCMAVGVEYPCSARFASNREGMEYRPKSSSNSTIGSGTSLPVVLIRWRLRISLAEDDALPKFSEGEGS